MKSIAEIQDNVAKLLCDYNIHLYHENQNIFITGVCQKSDQEIPWDICKI